MIQTFDGENQIVGQPGEFDALGPERAPFSEICEGSDGNPGQGGQSSFMERGQYYVVYHAYQPPAGAAVSNIRPIYFDATDWVTLDPCLAKGYRPSRDPDQLQSTGTKWLYFNTWTAPFPESSTSVQQLQKIYASSYVITRDEMPSLK